MLYTQVWARPVPLWDAAHNLVPLDFHIIIYLSLCRLGFDKHLGVNFDPSQRTSGMWIYSRNVYVYRIPRIEQSDWTLSAKSIM